MMWTPRWTSNRSLSLYGVNKKDTALKKLVVDKWTWGMTPERLMDMKNGLGGVVWAQDLWPDVALTL